MNKTKGPAQAASSEGCSQIKNQSSSDTLSQRAFGSTTAALWFLSSQLEAQRDQSTTETKLWKEFLMLTGNMQRCCLQAVSGVEGSLVLSRLAVEVKKS